MSKSENSIDTFIRSLEERAKELNCLYKIEELLSNYNNEIEDIFIGTIKAIPPGWQYPSYCEARIIFRDEIFQLDGFKPTKWCLKSNIKVQEHVVGVIEVYYLVELPSVGEGPFLKEERKLINTIADRIGNYLLHRQLKSVFEDLQNQKSEFNGQPRPEWSVIVEMLRRTDQHLFSIVAKKMINILFFKGIEESKELYERLGNLSMPDEVNGQEQNRPSRKKVLEDSYKLGGEIFMMAGDHLSDDEILMYLQKWMYENKTKFLLKALASPSTPLSELADAVRKYYHINPSDEENSPISTGIKVSLIRRFLTDQLDFIEIAKKFIEVKDFYELLETTIFPSESHGKLGGKSSGVIQANIILKKLLIDKKLPKQVKLPKTWYITSDGVTSFIYYNNLEDVLDQKYKDLDQVKHEYPHIIQIFKNSHFPPEIMNGMARALDDFGDYPIIVRSSSLLEDRMGAAFAGKYKSLFLANQGTKREKLEALTDAVAEVYASLFAPDPIGYRYEKGLLDFEEEMGIMIQEVVGTKVGNYYFPAFAGVAFSNNEFRWSPRIKRDDGLLRLVAGLGTRAVDRVGDDYPIMIAPGQQDLRVNMTYEEMVNYSPKNIDVIDLKSNDFVTLPITKLIKEIGNNFPNLNEVFSISENGNLRKPVGIGIDTKKHDIIVTFENLFSNTSFIKQIHLMLRYLKETLRVPVDLEFAYNGDDLYLLQCRPQSFSEENAGAIIPQDVDPEKIIFTANKYISNGKLQDILYIVYVDPDEYYQLESYDELREVGNIVGKLNKILPKRRFILMGPGRWGSRDDIRLGVKVTYSDINQTSMLIEIARKKGNYIPDLSFGTHFFQDLVEASIRYLPLYPDDEDVVFNNDFFRSSENILSELLPENGNLSKVVKVINVSSAKGNILRVLLNADEDRAMALLTDPGTKSTYQTMATQKDQIYLTPWKWRMQMVESIANNIPKDKFGVEKIYVFGSSVEETAMPQSDIDLIVHYNGDPQNKQKLETWFDGWSNSLSETNFRMTGYRVNNFLDVKYITEFDIKNNTELVRKMKSTEDFAKELNLNK